MFARVLLKFTELAFVIGVTAVVVVLLIDGPGMQTQLLAGDDCTSLDQDDWSGGYFPNGDPNGSESVTIVDALYILQYLFVSGSPEPVAICAAQGGGDFEPDQVEILSALTDYIEIVDVEDPEDPTILYPTVRFHGCNVQVVNDLGATNGNPADPCSTVPVIIDMNGLGNLIVGYNEVRTDVDCDGTGLVIDDRTGSHNLIVGSRNNYGTYGGVVFGRTNLIDGNGYATCTGGFENTSSGVCSALAGGCTNLSAASYSQVCGGRNNSVTAPFSAIVGGGGEDPADGNEIESSFYAVIVGGSVNTVDATNTVVVGGQGNTATGTSAVTVGGTSNTAFGVQSVVLGGNDNNATGENSTVSGGLENSASGENSTVGGGTELEADTTNGYLDGDS